ncbi:putative DNA-binding domain-containing protein [Marinimicrobium sp. C6131]|uniref:HvfC family RiPP maturation protein n=1 Tax=Marinimicrobium sp. C6131 TaxID=3022676 RepID=UPI00223CCE94|nr:putative DNA-binding domain-containing protein [Marinimicrobium sp. C6131]UZJ43312.1 putative DNA-binding domain-containing protein [Marinimicrobium sp. C6131]
MSVPDDYREALKRFAGAIRDPEGQPHTEVEARRMKIYQDLFFNNLNTFLSNNFPVFKSLMPEDWWLKEVRGFMQHHRCQSPLFSDIGREYIDYVNSDARPITAEDPPFMAELLHYEWVELALQIATNPAPEPGLHKDVMAGHPVLSPLAWPLEYRFPVHQIGPRFLPQEPPEQPTWVLVYRSRDRRVSFMALNAFTARLLALIEAKPDLSGRQLLEQMQSESPGVDATALMTGGELILQEFLDLGIIQGARPLRSA